jgi:hypothetical protein
LLSLCSVKLVKLRKTSFHSRPAFCVNSLSYVAWDLIHGSVICPARSAARKVVPIAPCHILRFRKIQPAPISLGTFTRADFRNVKFVKVMRAAVVGADALGLRGLRRKLDARRKEVSQKPGSIDGFSSYGLVVKPRRSARHWNLAVAL